MPLYNYHNFLLTLRKINNHSFLKLNQFDRLHYNPLFLLLYKSFDASEVTQRISITSQEASEKSISKNDLPYFLMALIKNQIL